MNHRTFAVQQRLVNLAWSAVLLFGFGNLCLAQPNSVQMTRDFIVDGINLTPKSDGSLLLTGSIFNVGAADAVLEIYDVDNVLAGDPILIPGHRPIPDSVYGILIKNQYNIAKSLASQYSIFDKRNPNNSQESVIPGDVIIPKGGTARITKASDYALAYNLLGLLADSVGLVPTAGKTIDNRLIREIIKEIMATSLDGFKTRILARNIGLNDIADLAAELTLNLVKAKLNPENLDGRTSLGILIKKHLVDLLPISKGLDAVALEGWAFDWLNAIVNLEAAYVNDSTLQLELAAVVPPLDTPSYQALECSTERELRSGKFDTPTSVEFTNERNQDIQTFWINYDGQRVFYNRLKPGTSYIQKTYVSHPWIVADLSGNCLAIYLPGTSPSRVAIRNYSDPRDKPAPKNAAATPVEIDDLCNSFIDSFTRDDGPVGNGWSDAVDNVGGKLKIVNHRLSSTDLNGGVGIYRPADITKRSVVTAKITEQNGFAGLRHRFSTWFLFGNDSHRASGYGVGFSRSDQNYNNSSILLLQDGVILNAIRVPFQFEASIDVRLTFYPFDNRFSGSVSSKGSSFDFIFVAPPTLKPIVARTFAVFQELSDGRGTTTAKPPIFPTIDDLTFATCP